MFSLHPCVVISCFLGFLLLKQGCASVFRFKSLLPFRLPFSSGCRSSSSWHSATMGNPPSCRNSWRCGRKSNSSRATLCESCFKIQAARSGARSEGNANPNVNKSNKGNTSPKINIGNKGNTTNHVRIEKGRASGRSVMKRSSKSARVKKRSLKVGFVMKRHVAKSLRATRHEAGFKVQRAWSDLQCSSKVNLEVCRWNKGSTSPKVKKGHKGSTKNHNSFNNKKAVKSSDIKRSSRAALQNEDCLCGKNRPFYGEARGIAVYCKRCKTLEIVNVVRNRRAGDKAHCSYGKAECEAAWCKHCKTFD